MTKLPTLAALGGVALLATAAGAHAKSPYFWFNPYFSDGTQAAQSRVIAGASPNLYSTYIDGVRCHYEYRVRYGQRVQVYICD